MAHDDKKLLSYIQNFAEALDNKLADIFNSLKNDGAPQRLIDAMAYTTLGGGKRIRPLLLVETASMFSPPDKTTLLAGCALECIHSYSLIHDDLPCMDNDDLRRGKPTLHKYYDEATAILAGDALQTLSFELLVKSCNKQSFEMSHKLITEFSRASGCIGMVGGQLLDLEAEGRFYNKHSMEKPSRNTVMKLQAMKTGTLFRFACLAGAYLGGAKDKEVKILTHYGEIIGLAFQLADDILDQIGMSTVIGKHTSKDQRAGKATWLTHLNLEQAQNLLKEQIDKALELLHPFGKNANQLKAITNFIATRTF